MNQSGQDKQLAALEQAIMARAAHLAGEFQEKAERQRDHILRDAAERLHNAEEREVMVAKAEAERLFRRVTQASELKLQGRLDQLRWELVQAVQGRLGDAHRGGHRAQAVPLRLHVVASRSAHRRLVHGDHLRRLSDRSYRRAAADLWRKLVDGQRLIATVDQDPGWPLLLLQIAHADSNL